jgi:hypothetical protein
MPREQTYRGHVQAGIASQVGSRPEVASVESPGCSLQRPPKIKLSKSSGRELPALRGATRAPASKKIPGGFSLSVLDLVGGLL